VSFKFGGVDKHFVLFCFVCLVLFCFVLFVHKIFSFCCYVVDWAQFTS
jgi:hypothetical protein